LRANRTRGPCSQKTKAGNNNFKTGISKKREDRWPFIALDKHKPTTLLKVVEVLNAIPIIILLSKD
jgi:hypothetical protein